MLGMNRAALAGLYQISKKLGADVEGHCYSLSSLNLVDRRGNLLEYTPTEEVGEDVYSIPRDTLRSILAGNIENKERVVKWNTRVLSVRNTLCEERSRHPALGKWGGDVKLELADGTVQSHDIVIGCDGFESLVRRQLFPSRRSRIPVATNVTGPSAMGTDSYKITGITKVR